MEILKEQIHKIQHLLAYNTYSASLTNALEDLLSEEETSAKISLELKAKTKKEALGFYLDYLLLSIQDKEITNDERLELSQLKRVLNIDDRDLFKVLPDRVKEVCNYALNQTLLQKYSIDAVNDDLQWALGLSLDEFESIVKSSDPDEEVVATPVMTEKKKIISVNSNVSNKNKPILTYSADELKSSSIGSIFFEKVTPPAIYYGLCLVVGYYTYDATDSLLAGIIVTGVSILLIQVLIISLLISLVASCLGAYFIYDLVGIFSENIIVKIGAGILAFLVAFGKLFQYNKEIYEDATNIDRSRHIPKSVRMEVFRRDGGRCVECHSDLDLEYDHIIPFSKGGSNTAKNIQLLCKECNRKKSSRIDG